jgi:molecular chaperone GrpE
MKNKNLNEDGVVELNIEDLDTPNVGDNNIDGVEEFVELNEEGEELSGKDQVKKLREKIKKLEIEKAEYLNSWQRTLADYKNREMQITKEKPEWGKSAVKRFAEDLLVVMDTYDAAKSNKVAWESVDMNWRGGIEYIFQTFENKLSEQGFEKFGLGGEVFNPEIHEGLGLVEVSEEEMNTKDIKPDTIAQIIMSGYKYAGQVMRPAKVKVYSVK